MASLLSQAHEQAVREVSRGSERPGSRRALAVLAGVTALSLVALWVGREPATAPGSAATWPHPDELDSLDHYLSAVAEAPPRAGEPGGWLPTSADPFDAVFRPAAPGLPGVPGVVVERPQIGLSAILIADKRRVAIVNEQLVALGDLVPGLGRVTAIEAERVVFTSATGDQRVLRLERREGS